MHRTKSILAAIAAVALSATAVFAAASAPPQAAADGLMTANNASGKTVPVRPEHPDATAGARSPEATESPEASETPEANEMPKPAKSPDLDATTGTGGPHPTNHGALVSAAAKAPTPSGFSNHGAYVRTIAHQNHGHGKSPAKTPVKVHGTKTTPTPTPTAH